MRKRKKRLGLRSGQEPNASGAKNPYIGPLGGGGPMEGMALVRVLQSPEEAMEMEGGRAVGLRGRAGQGAAVPAGRGSPNSPGS